MEVDFKVPLEDYLKLLADSSGYTYIPSVGELKCKPTLIPLDANTRVMSSRGKLQTVYDYLNQVGFFVLDEYSITVREHEKSITLTCDTELSNLIKVEDGDA